MNPYEEINEALDELEKLEKIENMTEDFFDRVVENTLDGCRETLVIKGKEYRRNNNPMHNFEVGARIEDKTREEILHGMALKHHISIRDIREDITKGILPNKKVVEEKFGDAINYLILEKASILDRIENSNK